MKLTRKQFFQSIAGTMAAVFGVKRASPLAPINDPAFRAQALRNCAEPIFITTNPTPGTWVRKCYVEAYEDLYRQMRKFYIRQDEPLRWLNASDAAYRGLEIEKAWIDELPEISPLTQFKPPPRY